MFQLKKFGDKFIMLSTRGNESTIKIMNHNQQLDSASFPSLSRFRDNELYHIEWYRQGKLHRELHPAVLTINRQILDLKFYHNGILMNEISMNPNDNYMIEEFYNEFLIIENHLLNIRKELFI